MNTVSRRSVLAAGAAWTGPVILVAAAAPAQAASPPLCSTVAQASMTFATVTAGQTAKGTGSGTSNTTVSITTAYVGATDKRHPTNNMNATGFAGGLGIFQYLGTRASNTATSNYQDITFTFSQPVSLLSFVIGDIDTSVDGVTNPFRDRIAVVASDATFTSSNGSSVQGAGTQANPWMLSGSGWSNGAETDAAYATTVNFTGPVTTFTLRFWELESSSTTAMHAVFIRSMNFKPNCTP